MWRVAFCALAVLCVAASGESVRVLTWNLEWFPSGSSNAASPEQEAANIKSAADVIALANPDVVLLQEVRDWEACSRLAAAMSPAQYQVVICSAFRDAFGGGIGRQQVAILAKQQAEAAWAERWKNKGVVDPPRGFAFAVIKCGKTQIGFYSVHLKSNLVMSGGDKAVQLNILKRELSAEQLVSHLQTVSKGFPTLAKWLVGGDLNTNRDQDLFLSERTLAIFEEAGFLDSLAAVPLAQRVTHPKKGRYPDATFDYVLAKGFSSAGVPELIRAGTSDHFPLVVELEVP